MFDDGTSPTAAATDDICHFNSSGEMRSLEVTTVSAAVGDLNNKPSVFVTLRTVCFCIVCFVGVVGNLTVLTLIIHLRNRKQVGVMPSIRCSYMQARFMYKLCVDLYLCIFHRSPVNLQPACANIPSEHKTSAFASQAYRSCCAAFPFSCNFKLQ